MDSEEFHNRIINFYLNKLRDCLISGEEILEAVLGSLKEPLIKGKGVFVLTPQRIIFFTLGKVFGGKQSLEEIPLSRVNSIELVVKPDRSLRMVKHANDAIGRREIHISGDKKMTFFPESLLKSDITRAEIFINKAKEKIKKPKEKEEIKKDPIKTVDIKSTTQENLSPSEKWEYKIISPRVEGWLERRLDYKKIEQSLDKLGDFGWELISIISTTKQAGWGSETGDIYFIFKRRRT